MIRRIVSMLCEVVSRRPVIHQLVRQHLVLRYRRTMLGYLWTLVNPLLMMSVTAVVFSHLFKTDLKDFAIFLFAGMVAWNCFSQIVIQSSQCLITQEGLIRKVYLPKMIFPLSVAIGILIDSVLSLIALFIIILALGGPLTWALAFLPVAYLLLFFFSLGMALMVSIFTVFFRDLQQVITILMQALFFLTPILYEKTAIMGEFGMLLRLNPITPFVELFRLPIYHGMLPDNSIFLGALSLAVLAMGFGLAIFTANEKKIVFRL